MRGDRRSDRRPEPNAGWEAMRWRDQAASRTSRRFESGWRLASRRDRAPSATAAVRTRKVSPECEPIGRNSLIPAARFNDPVQRQRGNPGLTTAVSSPLGERKEYQRLSSNRAKSLIFQVRGCFCRRTSGKSPLLWPGKGPLTLPSPPRGEGTRSRRPITWPPPGKLHRASGGTGAVRARTRNFSASGATLPTKIDDLVKQERGLTGEDARCGAGRAPFTRLPRGE
jgi:hypothetical protein